MSRITKTIEYHLDGLPVPFAPLDCDDHITKVSADGLSATAVVISHDEFLCNPLEDDEYLGSIWHHPNSKYGDSEDRHKYHQALGLDQYGEPDLEQVVDAYRDRLKDAVRAADLTAITHILGASGDPDIENLSHTEVRDLLLNDIDNSVNSDDEMSNVVHSLSWELWGTSDFPAELGEAVEAVFAQSPTTLQLWHAARDAGTVGDRDAVLLDRYEHGLCQYRVSSDARDWDLSKGEAVWVPTATAREQIEERAKVYAFGRIEELQLRGPNAPRYHAIVNPYSDHAVREDGGNIGGFEHWYQAYEKLREHTANFVATSEQLAGGRYAAAVEMAAQACETYTSWCNGETYRVDVFSYKRASVDEDWPLPYMPDDCCTCYGTQAARDAAAEYQPNLGSEL